MSLPTPDFDYNSDSGFGARETRLNLERSSLGRDRTLEEEVAYWTATCTELQEEFPGAQAEWQNANKRRLAAEAALAVR